MDIVDLRTRSRMMAGIRGRNTKPELVVRSLLHREGCRFRLHESALPGRPDIVMKRRRTVVFVHGCYWHRHTHCRNATLPKTNREFWLRKLQSNVRRDRRNVRDLLNDGWRVLIVWECAVREAGNNPERLQADIRVWLGSREQYHEIGIPRGSSNISPSVRDGRKKSARGRCD